MQHGLEHISFQYAEIKTLLLSLFSSLLFASLLVSSLLSSLLSSSLLFSPLLSSLLFSLPSLLPLLASKRSPKWTPGVPQMTPKWRLEMSWTPPGAALGPKRDEPAVPEDLWDHPDSFFGRPGEVLGRSGDAFWTLPGAFWGSIRLSSLLLSSLPVASSKQVAKVVFFFLFVSLPKCSIICVFSIGSALGRSRFRSRLVLSVRPKIHPKWFQN